MNKAFLYFVIILCLSMTAELFAKSESAASLNDKSYEQLQKGNYQQSYKIASQAKIKSKQENNIIELARALSNIASGLTYLGNNEKALELYSESLALSKREKNLLSINRALNNIAGIYNQIKDYDEGLKYRKLQLENSLLSGNKEDQLVAYIGLADNFLMKNDKKNVQANIFKAEELLKEYSSEFIRVYFLLSKAAQLTALNQNSQAINAYDLALKLSEKNNYYGLVVISRMHLARTLLANNQLEPALKQALICLSESQSLDYKRKEKDTRELLSEIYVKKTMFEKALYHTKQANQLSESLAGEKVKFLAEITRIDRRVEETQTELLQSQKDQKIMALELEQQDQNQIFWIVVLLGGFATLFLFYSRMISKKEIARQKQVNKKLKELDRVKDRILKNTSHELRTPLNGIIGLSEVITEEYKNKIDQDVLEMVGLIKSSGEQLALVVNDILEMSKSRSNEITIINSEFDLIALIGDVIKICSPLAKEKNLKLKFQHSNKVESVFLDKTRLQQILFNIIGNAVKFTKQGSIDVSYILEEYGVKLVILDTGIGIPEDKIERILEGFEQVDSSDTRVNSGSGLGLAISRNICQAIGGNIEISSTMNIGTQVTITLPFSG